MEGRTCLSHLGKIYLSEPQSFICEMGTPTHFEGLGKTEIQHRSWHRLMPPAHPQNGPPSRDTGSHPAHPCPAQLPRTSGTVESHWIYYRLSLPSPLPLGGWVYREPPGHLAMPCPGPQAAS